MFSTKLLKLAVDRSLGKPTKNQGELFEELYKEYMGDPNSSTLREQITAAGINAESWFPKLAQCPDADHYISAYVVDLLGNITWQN